MLDPSSLGKKLVLSSKSSPIPAIFKEESCREMITPRIPTYIDEDFPWAAIFCTAVEIAPLPHHQAKFNSSRSFNQA